MREGSLASLCFALKPAREADFTKPFSSHSFPNKKIGPTDADPIFMVELMGRYSKTPEVPKLGQITHGSPEREVRPRVHNVHKRLGPELVAQLIADYQAGAPSTALMRKYKLGKGTVLSILYQAGVKMRRPKDYFC